MKKILILSPEPNIPGGVSNFIKLLDQYLTNRKFEISYVHTGKSYSFIINVLYPFLIIDQILKINKKVKVFKPDLVHMNPSLSSIAIIRDFIFLKTINKHKIPVVFFIHGWQKKLSKKFESPLFKRYFKKRFEMADSIIVLAKEFKEDLIRLGINSEKVYLSSTMVESANYYPINKEFNKPYTILFCARMKKEKGPFTVLNAVPQVLNEFPETKFLFIGSGKDLGELKEKSKEMDLENNVQFTGYISEKEKQEYFKKCHIFVFPTEHGEGFPTVILEAMASGMPLISTAVAGLKDILEDGKQGLIIKCNPPESKELSQKIIQLLRNENYMKQISKYNINEAKEKYDVKKVCKKIEAVYLEINNKKYK